MSTGEVRFIGTVTNVDGEISVITLDDKYCPGLDKLESYDEIFVLYWLSLIHI